MIDKLSLTIDILPDIEYLESNGKIIEDQYRRNIYKYMCRLDKAVIFYLPHKFSETTNAQIPVSKVDINPKYFTCYSEMLSYIFAMFVINVKEDDFNPSRIDVAVDIEGISTDSMLSMLRVEKIRSASLSFYKGTIYAGTNPKIRIYDKVEEIRARLRRGAEITDYEKMLIESGNIYTRFEIQVRLSKKTLKDIAEDPESFASYFDRLQVFDFGGNDHTGVLQVRYKYINHKLRDQLEIYRNFELVKTLKDVFIKEVKLWFNPETEPF